MSAEIDLSRIRFRMLSYTDFIEFKKSAIASVETNEPYLSYGTIFKEAPVLQYLEYYFEMLAHKLEDHYGFFDGRTLLGHTSFQYGWSFLGTEIVGWVKKGLQNQKLGEFGLEVAIRHAFEHKGFNYIQLCIDSKNIPSQKVAEKLGFRPLLKILYTNDSYDHYIYYIKVNPEISALAKQFRIRDIDLMNNPSTAVELRYYLNSENILDFYSWPFPAFTPESKPIRGVLTLGFRNMINLHEHRQMQAEQEE